MPIRRDQESDGITAHPVTRIGGYGTVDAEGRWQRRQPSPAELAADRAALAAVIAEHAAAATWTARIAPLSEWCARHQPAPDATPAYGSRAWYARQLAIGIRATDHARTRGDVETALAEARDVGILWAEAEAKGWPDLRLGREHRAHQAIRARKGAAARREANAQQHERLIELVRRYRARNPHAGPRTMARALTNRKDDLRAIDRLRKRIERLLPALK